MTDGRWHHVAILYDRTTAVPAQAIRVFVDHKETPDVVDLKFVQLLNVDFGQAPLFIGARNRSAYPFQGWLDEFRVSAPLLTPKEFLAMPQQPAPQP